MNRRPAPLVIVFAAFLAGAGSSARAQDSEEDLLPRSPWAAVGTEPAEADEAAEAADDAESSPDTGAVPVAFPRVAPKPPPPPPAASQDTDSQDTTPQDAPLPEDEQNRRLRTWEMPAVEVVGSGLKEEERIGSYKQPRWTAERLFPTTRIYVLPEGAMHGEYWMRIDEPHHGETRIRDYYEIEFGLPNRFQLDLYLVADHTGEHEPGAINQQMIEGRYAFADWDEIWGNPTVYLEYIHRNDDPEKIEGKLLLGGESAPGWHWGTNLTCELETSGEHERELAVSGGLSRTIIDNKFSLGFEGKVQQTDTRENPGDDEDTFLIGPSMRWLPSDRAHLDFAPLLGIGNDSPSAEIWLIYGWEF